MGLAFERQGSFTKFTGRGRRNRDRREVIGAKYRKVNSHIVCGSQTYTVRLFVTKLATTIEKV